MYIITSCYGERYCSDNTFRVSAMFGTKKWCVKEYKSFKWAMKKADELTRKGFDAKVVEIPHDGYMDMAGNVWRDSVSFPKFVHISDIVSNKSFIPGVIVYNSFANEA